MSKGANQKRTKQKYLKAVNKMKLEGVGSIY